MTVLYQPSIPDNGASLRQFEQTAEQRLADWLTRERGQSARLATLLWKKIRDSVEIRFVKTQVYEENVIWTAVQRYADEELVKLQAAMDKNFGLTEDVFSDLADHLKSGDDGLFEQIFLQHFESCRNYLKRQFGASHEDAYDATMHTLLEFHHRIRDGKIQYGNLRFLFTRMAGQFYFKWIKKENLKTELGDVDIPDETDQLDPETLSTLDKAWDRLCDSCRSLLKAFYYDKKSLIDLAPQVGKEPAALRKQKQRCIEKLRDIFTQLI